jgi:D-tyrosyl-tRNA(Tyr) deacylase
MRAVIQRVNEASVIIAGKVHSAVSAGLLILIGIEDTDTDEDIRWLSAKITQLRIFNDEQGTMNRSVKDVNGELMVVSQFTLHASTKKGNRPSYSRASNPEIAIPLYERFVGQLQQDSAKHIQTGAFGADMKVRLVNDGPVTIIIDTKNKE